METLGKTTNNRDANKESDVVKKRKPVRKRTFQFFTRMGALGYKVEVIPGEFEVDKAETVNKAVEQGLKATKLG